MARCRVIDNHCHYQNQDGFLERMLERGLAAGVEKFCLNGGGPRWRQHGNDEVLRAAEAHPDHVIPVAFCYLGEDSAADVYAWCRAGFRGLKIQYPSASYGDDAFFTIYQAAEECRLPILFHTGISARFDNHDHWDTSSLWMAPLPLDRIARCFPNLVIWAAHLGLPDTWHAAHLMRRHPHLYFDLCGTDVSREQHSSITQFGELFYAGEEHFGKLVFGSEGGPDGFAPLIAGYERMLDAHGVGPEVQERIFWGNVAGALGIE